MKPRGALKRSHLFIAQAVFARPRLNTALGMRISGSMSLDVVRAGMAATSAACLCSWQTALPV